MSKLTIEATGNSDYIVSSGNRFIVLTRDETIAFIARAVLMDEEWWGMHTYEEEIRRWPHRFVEELAGLLTYTPMDEQPTQFTADFLYNPAA